MDFKVFFIILLLSQIGLAFKNFRNLEILQSPRYYGIQSKTVYITCPVHCENCTQAEILWFKDGKELDSKIFTSTPQGINISHYIPNIYNGNYSCIFKSKQVTLRSAPISLISRYIPEYTLQNTSAKIGNTAIFHCYKSTYSAIIGKDYFYVTWFRGNSSLPLSLSHNLIIKGKFLFIKNVQPRDKGPYSCQLNVRPKNIVSLKRSGSFYLNVEDNHDKDVFPLFFTPSRDVALHMSFTVFCLLNHYNGNFTLRLFKLSDDGRIEVKVREQSDVGYLTYKITSFEIENAAIYVCEALRDGVRSREESVFNFVNAPELKNKHIFHYNQVLHANITLYCDVTTSFPTPTFKWYYNGYPLQISTGKNVISSSDGLISKLFIMNLDVTDEGIYQCITENTVGNDVKYFDLRLGTSEFAPKNLVIKLVSPVQVTLTWSHGELSLSSSSRSYLVSWFHEDIDNNVGHLRTSETSALISGNGLFGGRRYRFLVCLFVEETMDYSDCVAQYITMPQDVPIKSPQMFEPKQEQQIGEKKIYFVRWKEIPDPLSMGIIRNYTIYCKEISTIQRQQQPQNELITFSQPYGASSAYIYLPDNCTYKVWMTAVNDAGESPGSKSFYVQTALTEEIYTDTIEFSVAWGRNSYGSAAAVSLKTPENFTGIGFRLYYVQIPYKDYLKSFKAVELHNNAHFVQISHLSSASSYRFTIAPIYLHRSPDPHCVSKRLGKLSSVYLYRVETKQQSLLNILLSHVPVIPAPRDLKCYSFYQNSLVITWRPPKTGTEIISYFVEMFSDVTGTKQTYIVKDTILSLRNLNEGYWYGVRVRTQVKNLNAPFYYTPFISCVTKYEVPSKPRNISHAFIYSKVDKLIYLKLEWQRPVYMGAETYSYIVRRQANPTSPKKLNPEYAIKVVFPLCEYSLFDGDHFDSWLVMKAVRTEGNNIHHQISISAVNDAGEGEAETFESSVANIPDSWEIRGRKKSGHDQSKKINDHDEGEQSNDLYLGVGIGLSVSAVFLTVLVVICLVKEPCKRIPRESRQFLLTDDFLFMQRMKERSRGGEGSSMGGEGSSRGGERETNDRQYGKNRTRLKEGAIILRMARPFLNIYNRYRHPDSREDSGSTEEALYSLSSGSVSNRSQITMIGTSSENYLQTASAVL